MSLDAGRGAGAYQRLRPPAQGPVVGLEASPPRQLNLGRVAHRHSLQCLVVGGRLVGVNVLKALGETVAAPDAPSHVLAFVSDGIAAPSP